MQSILSFLLLLIALWMLPVDLFSATDYVCGQDLNGDGDTDEAGETAQCIPTAQGQLCPIGAANCGSAYQCNLTGDKFDTLEQCIAGCAKMAGCTAIYTCPAGGQYECMDNGGTLQCSPNQCVDLTSNPPVEENPAITDPSNNGQIDNQGSCLGQIYIFSGKTGECRPPGIGTSFFNCCSNNEGSFLFFKKYCKDTEWQTNAARDAGSCHYVGDYCKTKWPIVGCVQKARVYCCFNSKLGRIIQEQGRIQLRAFSPDGSWGSPEGANCRGFKPEEFQMLDFSRIDLSEYFTDIKTKASDQIQQKIGDRIGDFYDNIR